jgi:mannose-1-phosphate guanylyltransferase
MESPKSPSVERRGIKALILVGGFGTRLRPLTIYTPKPLVEFCNKATLFHQIEALAEVGVVEVILAVSFGPEKMKEALAEAEKRYGVKISISLETYPLGTAGPLALARDRLMGDYPFFVLNSDITCLFPFKDLLAFHKAHGREGTIMVTRVEEPSRYGVVLAREDGQIEKFVEKPQVYVGNRINAGIYIFNPSILDRIQVKPTSIEKEIFPKMAAAGELYAMDLHGFWMDVGQHEDFLRGTALHLKHMLETTPEKLASGPDIIPPVLIDPTARIGQRCVIGPNVVIGKGCVIEDGVRLSDTTLLPRSRVQSYSWISRSIVSWDCIIGRWVRMENMTVLGESVKIADELYLNGAKILPHKDLAVSIFTPDTVM